MDFAAEADEVTWMEESACQSTFWGKIGSF